ncbi:diguanylate cyclase [Thermotoga sp. KOL6]|uniref:GGDEF domain-containing protein n=1 Tax=Thermotoga sp. KOL6 TaxID=126741 RepID=UPI000C77AD4F|nr:GGDEF domain-containing protein [Thermotoga sp. KOL6]PLV59919.1 hypothetical protein AS005_01085 [Thermotoga sp. KOL6]
MKKFLYHVGYHIVSLIAGISVFVLLAFLFVYTMHPEGGYPIQTWRVLRSSINTSRYLNTGFRLVSKTPIEILIKANLPEKAFESSKRYLYIPQAYFSYLAVYANDLKIGAMGLEEKRSGHFWYRPVFFELPNRVRELSIELSGIYEVGIESAYLIDRSNLSRYLALLFLTNTVSPMIIGFSIALSSIILIIALSLHKGKRINYIHLAIAGFLSAVWMFDLVDFIDVGGSDFLLFFRKLLVSSAYLGLSALIVGIERILFGKMRKVGRILAILNLTSGIIVWITGDFVALDKITSTVSILLFVDSIYLLIDSFASYSKILSGAAFFFSLCILHDGMVLSLSIESKLISNYGVIGMFFGLVYFLVNEYKEMYVKATVDHVKSLIDPLTGGYNRGILTEVQFSDDDTFVFIDINDFKKINDVYGHDVGDQILRFLVEKIKENIRSSDLIIRMGGDEFLVVLRNCNTKKAHGIFQKILDDFNCSHPSRPTFSYGITKFQGSLAKTLEVVDNLMYKMKKKPKKYRFRTMNAFTSLRISSRTYPNSSLYPMPL